MCRILQKSENKWQRIKGARRPDLLDDMAFSLNKDLCDCKKKRKAKEKNTEDYSVNLWLKEMPLYEKLNAKNEIRGIVFKYQRTSIYFANIKAKSNNAR